MPSAAYTTRYGTPSFDGLQRLGRTRAATDFPTRCIERWTAPRIFGGLDGTEFTRRSLVLAVTNMAGGAHVDPKPPAALDLVMSRDLQPIERNGIVGGYDTRPAFAMIAQIGWELLYALDRSAAARLRPASDRPQRGRPRFGRRSKTDLDEIRRRHLPRRLDNSAEQPVPIRQHWSV